MAKNWLKLGMIGGVVLLLVAAGSMSAYADTPDPPTPTATETPSVPPETTITTGVAIAETPHTSEGTLASEPTVPPTITARVGGSSQPTSAPTPLTTLLPTSTAAAAATPAPTMPSTAHIAVLIGEAVIPIQGTAISEVFVSLKDVEPGVVALTLFISFDPEIVQIVDADNDPSNGVQLATSAFFAGSQRVDLNEVDNRAGRISLALSQQQGDPVQRTDAWRKVAAITWVAKQEGKSVVTIDSATRFTTAGKQMLRADETNDGVVFSLAPGTIEGIVELQGRTSYGDIVVSASLASPSVDKAQTDASGHFSITTSHGEGFYTLEATSPGYLSAESSRPVKVTVGRLAYIGQVTLLGGDVNHDNCVDIRDLSYVAWHFKEYDAKADINGDGQVDILDLSLTAGNFDQCGPTVWVVSDGTD